mgnify:CR=1 FL=1
MRSNTVYTSRLADEKTENILRILTFLFSLFDTGWGAGERSVYYAHTCPQPRSRKRWELICVMHSNVSRGEKAWVTGEKNFLIYRLVTSGVRVFQISFITPSIYTSCENLPNPSSYMRDTISMINFLLFSRSDETLKTIKAARGSRSRNI